MSREEARTRTGDCTVLHYSYPTLTPLTILVVDMLEQERTKSMAMVSSNVDVVDSDREIHLVLDSYSTDENDKFLTNITNFYTSIDEIEKNKTLGNAVQFLRATFRTYFAVSNNIELRSKLDGEIVEVQERNFSVRINC